MWKVHYEGLSNKEKKLFFILFFRFVAVLLATKPRGGGGGAKGLSGLSTKKNFFLRLSLGNTKLYTSEIGPFGGILIGDWLNLNAGFSLVKIEN